MSVTRRSNYICYLCCTSYISLYLFVGVYVYMYICVLLVGSAYVCAYICTDIPLCITAITLYAQTIMSTHAARIPEVMCRLERANQSTCQQNKNILAKGNLDKWKIRKDIMSRIACEQLMHKLTRI